VRTIYGLVGIPITDLARIAQASGLRYIGPKVIYPTPIQKESSMACHAGIKIALAGGAVMVALAAGVGGGAGLSNATPPTPVALPASVVGPPPPPPHASGVPPSSPAEAPARRNYYLVPSEIRD
jgi:hypothetical protein